MALSQPFVRLSNIEKYTPMLSSDDIMQKMLNPQANFFKSFKSNKDTFNDSDIEKLREISAQVLTTVFHTMTTNAATTKEILETIYDQCDKFIFENGITDNKNKKAYKDAIVAYISQYIKFIHEDYKIVTDTSESTETLLSETNFCIPKTQPEDGSYEKTVKDKKGKETKIKTNYFKHNDQFGLIAYEIDKKNKLEVDSTVTLPNKSSKSRDKIFTVRDVVESKLVEELGTLKANGKVDAEGRVDLDNYLNAVNLDDQLQIGKNNASLSYILMNNPQIRTGTKNSLEIATFLNNLSTFELSKCYPYLDVKFLLPEFVTTKSSKIYKTASIVEFLKGTPISDDAIGNTYKVLEASYIKEDIKTSEKTIKQPAVETNMSAFTMPQTAVNFDETFVGHLESYKDSKNNLVKAASSIFERNNIVHDYTKPFLTIKSFNVDIAPTAGLMSFKTGRLSMTLHDKTRMADIAPFIKPDLFGSFGAEIAIQYGWSHMDAMSNMTKTLKETFAPNKDTNYFAEFLDTNKIYEKYIITNSSYSIDANGQVNIDLSIAMKGPIEIRSITFETDQPKQIDAKSLERLSKRLIRSVYSLSGMDSQGKSSKIKASKLTKFKLPTNGLITVINNVVQEYKSNTNPTGKGELKNINLYITTVNNHTKDWRAAGGKEGNTSKARLFHSLKALAAFPGVTIVFAAKSGNSISNTTIAAYEKQTNAETKKTSYKTFEDALTGANVPIGEIEKLNIFYSRLVSFIRSSSYAVVSGRKDLDQTIKTLLTKFTGGLSNEDPFFDKQNFSDIEMVKDELTKKEYDNQRRHYCMSIKGIDINNTNDKRLTNYVSLGNFILALLGSHTAYSGSFDEIQIISYTLNDNAGLAANSNISSLLIDKNELESFIYELFKNGAQYTLESLFMQVVKKFVTTRYCINYGLSDFYILDENNNVIPRIEKQSEFKTNINERIKKIYEYRSNRFSKSKSLVDSIKFVMPKIKFLFDSMTRDTGSISVLRISIIDQNDNPFQSTQQILQNISEKGLQSAIYDINSRFIDLKSKAKEKKDIDKLKLEYIQKNQEIIKKLLKQKILVIDSDGQYILNSTINEGDLSVGIKNNLKTMMPSITYGANNSAIIEASISTINEAKLNTVYITRPNRNSAPIKSKVKYAQDLPLRILPSQVNVTMFGCPFINFAQYLFLDFETNTTIDNQYIVTGLKHDITPGKFITTLTLSYGDAYGKYETIVDTLNRTLKEIETGEIVTSKTVISKKGVEVIKDASTGYDLTGILSIPKLFPNLSDDDEKAMGWDGNKEKAINPVPKLYGSDGIWSEDIIEIKGLDHVVLRSHNTSDEDKLSYSMKIKPIIIKGVTFKYLIKFNKVEYYYSAVKKSKSSFYIIDISKKIMSSSPTLKNKRKSLVYEILGHNFIMDDELYYNKTNDKTFEAQLKRTSQIPDGQVHQWRKFFDIFALINSKIVWKGMGKNKKNGDKEVVFEKFFDTNVAFFFKLQDLINTPYLVSKYTDDVKNISFEMKSYYEVLKHYNDDKTLFDKLLNLVNTIDKNITFTDTRRSIKNVGGYKLDNIEIDIVRDEIILTFKSTKQVTKKVKRKNTKVHKTLILEIDLFALFISVIDFNLDDFYEESEEGNALMEQDLLTAPDFLSDDIPES